MDKPISMPVKDYLIKIMSVRTNTPQKIIEAVVNHQFEGVIEAMEKPGIHSIEVSGFGKFLFNGKKAIKARQAYQKEQDKWREALKAENLTETKKNAILQKIAEYENWKEKSKEKINAFRSDMGRLEEQPLATEGAQGEDREDVSGEIEDLPGLPSVLREHEEDRMDDLKI